MFTVFTIYARNLVSLAKNGFTKELPITQITYSTVHTHCKDASSQQQGNVKALQHMFMNT